MCGKSAPCGREAAWNNDDRGVDLHALRDEDERRPREGLVQGRELGRAQLLRLRHEVLAKQVGCSASACVSVRDDDPPLWARLGGDWAPGRPVDGTRGRRGGDVDARARSRGGGAARRRPGVNPSRETPETVLKRQASSVRPGRGSDANFAVRGALPLKPKAGPFQGGEVALEGRSVKAPIGSANAAWTHSAPHGQPELPSISRSIRRLSSTEYSIGNWRRVVENPLTERLMACPSSARACCM